MKKNKKFYGLLGGVMALALATPFVAYNVAKADTLYNDVVAWYDFDDQSLTNSKGDDNAEAIVTYLSSYSGDLTYGDDRDSDNTEGHALKLGDYGIELNEENLGDNFSVSFWVKPDGTITENQVMLFLGYNSPEDWYAISGNSTGTNQVKIWCRNTSDSSYNGWYTKATTTIDSDGWHHVVVTGDDTTHITYVDGNVITSSDFTNVLSGENQDIYIGVNYWDPEFTGYIDDVIVYNRTISAGEVERLYTGQTADKLLEESEISVSDLSTVVGRTAQLEITVPEAVKEDAAISYSIDDTSIATVDSDGVVTGVSAGKTTVTVAASIENVEKTASATITVESTLDSYLVADLSLDNNLTDGTGNCNVTLYGSTLTDYTGDVSYGEGVEGQGIDLSGYGFDLGLTDIGTDFTVSFYVNPKTTQVANQIMVQLGYHDPELWTSISGTGTDGTYKLWGNTASAATTTGSATSMAWTTVLSPSIPTGEWSLVSLVGTDGTITAYIDGICIGSGSYNNPLCGENQSIYFGVNNWDTCFDGMFDEIKVYSLALTQEEIIANNTDFIAGKLQTNLETVTAYDNILGDNESADAIKYDLVLPSASGSTSINWESSNESIIATDGSVVNPEEDTDVTLTATITLADATASVTREFTVLCLDRTELDALIEIAESYDLSYATEVSANRLTSAIEEAKEANSFSTIESCTTKLQKAIAGLVFEGVYVDPFELISEATVSASVKQGKTVSVFAIPDSILDMVDVECESGNEKVCTYDDGVVTAKKAGNTIVTAIVTAKSDGYTMNYSTAVSVTKKDSSSSSSSSSSSGSSSSSSSSNSSSGTSSSSSSSSSSSNSSSSSSSSSSDTTGTTTYEVAETQTPNAIAGNAGRRANGNVIADEDETVIEDEAAPVAGDEAVDESNTESDTTIEDEDTPATGQNDGEINVAFIVVMIIAVLVAFGFVCIRLGFFKKIK